MAILTYLICVFVPLFIEHITADQPCPFNPKECNCTGTSDNITFDSATCVSLSGSVVYFVAPSQGVKYKVDTLYITGNVADLPANYFEGFSSLNDLQLQIPGDPPARPYQVQNWDESAFDGVNISRLYTYGLSNVLPPSTALSKLGSRGLLELSVNYGDPLRLYNYMMRDFTSLSYLYFVNVDIIQISDRAFDGLEKSLTYIWLENTACPTVERRSFEAFKLLKKLGNLTLKNTGIIDYPHSAFTVFPELYRVTLSEPGGNLIPAMNAGALLNLPSTLLYVEIGSSGQSQIPELSYEQGISKLQLVLYYNEITKITAADIDRITNITSSLDLSYNPITTIEQAFPNINSIDLSNTNLTSLDLSLIANVGTAYFENNPSLKNIIVSDLSKVFVCTRVYVNDGLETIDSQVATVLVKYPNFVLDINYNSNLNCDQLTWMAPFVLCSKQVIVSSESSYSTCSNGQSAADYFNNLHFNCTAFSIAMKNDRFAINQIF